MATKIEKIEILEAHNIQWDIDSRGNIIGLWKMTTHFGDDCSEWFEYDRIIEILKEAKLYENC